MSAVSKFGKQIKSRREELGLSRDALARQLEVTASAVSNYENGLSFPRESVMLRLFDSLETDPNHLFRGCYRGEGTRDRGEQRLLRRYRRLSRQGREALLALLEALSP